MNIRNFFSRIGGMFAGTDTKALLIKHALRSEDTYQDLVDVLDDHLCTPECVIPVIYGLTRATGELIKALEKEGLTSRGQFDDMLSVWLRDVDDDNDPYYSMRRRFGEYKQICG